jgi:polar amino acid transport system substrate-binding protein
MKAAISIIVGLLATFSANCWSQYVILISPAPPFISEDGKSGISIDIVKEIFKRSKQSYEFKTMPLARALDQAANKANHCVLPVQRSQEKETTYRWISPVLVTQSALFSNASSPVPLSVLTDGREKSIGVLRGSDEEQYLKGNGFPKVQEANDELNNAKKLGSNRVDLWATDSILGPYYAKKAGVSVKQEVAFRSTLRALACHIDMPENVVESLSNSLKEMYGDGTVKKIFAEYTKGLDIGDLGLFLE